MEYNLRNYQHKDQIGTEQTAQDYIKNLINIFRECKRVLKDTGSIWVNIADSYVGGGGKANENSFVRDRDPNLKFSQDYPAKSKLRSTMGKSLMGVPERFVIAMQDELGLIRRNTIIWFKPSCMPSSAKDRFTIDFEYFYFFTKKSDGYYFETQYEPMKTDMSIEYKGKAKKDYAANGVQDPSDIKKRMIESYKKKAIKFGGTKYPNNQDNVQNATYSGNAWVPNELGRIKRCVWSLNTGNSVESHFASYPERLIETPIKACCPKGGIVLDPFLGAGTTAITAKKLERNYVGIELNSKYINIANRRLGNMIEAYL